MKKIALTLIMVIPFMVSCVDENKNESNSEVKNEMNISLDFIDKWNQLELAHTDDKYGEWGGDSDVILVYSDGKKIYADYSKYLGSYEPPMPPKENEKPKKWYEYKMLELKIDSIELNNVEIGLIEKAIVELAKKKINNRTSFSHAGIVNKVISSDSSFIIKDYPSNDWVTFKKLKKKLTEK